MSIHQSLNIVVILSNSDINILVGHNVCVRACVYVPACAHILKLTSVVDMIERLPELIFYFLSLSLSQLS